MKTFEHSKSGVYILTSPPPPQGGGWKFSPGKRIQEKMCTKRKKGGKKGRKKEKKERKKKKGTKKENRERKKGEEKRNKEGKGRKTLLLFRGRKLKKFPLRGRKFTVGIKGGEKNSTSSKNILPWGWISLFLYHNKTSSVLCKRKSN